MQNIEFHEQFSDNRNVDVITNHDVSWLLHYISSIVKHKQRQRVQRICMGEGGIRVCDKDDRPDKSQKASKIDNRKPKISFFFVSLFIYFFYFYSIFIRMHFSKIVIAKISFRFDYTINVKFSNYYFKTIFYLIYS